MKSVIVHKKSDKMPVHFFSNTFQIDNKQILKVIPYSNILYIRTIIRDNNEENDQIQIFFKEGTSYMSIFPKDAKPDSLREVHDKLSRELNKNF